MKQEPEEPRPSHHHRRITEAAPPPTNNHSIHHKFIHDHCCSSVSSNCVFFCPHPNNHRIHFWAEGRRVKGTAAALCPRRDTPPGRRVGFFARVLSFLLCKKKCFPGFSFLPRDLFGHPSTLWRFPYMGAPWSRPAASPASPSVHRPAPNQVCNRRERKSI